MRPSLCVGAVCVLGLVSFVCSVSLQTRGQRKHIPSATEEEKRFELNSPRYLLRRATTVFRDDFSSGHIDSTKWRHSISATGVGHHQFMMYTTEPANSYVKNGVLHICPTLTVDRFGEDFLRNGVLDIRELYGTCTSHQCHREGWNHIPPVMSAFLIANTHVRYGKVEIMAKLAKGDWFWNAMWMMPNDNEYGWWPRSGEIDLLEAAGNRHYTLSNGASAGVDTAHCTIHYGADPDHDHRSNGKYALPSGTLGDGFHRYWLDWTEDRLILGVDEHPVTTLTIPDHGLWEGGSDFPGTNIWAHGAKSAPFDKSFFLQMNVAVGGDMFWHGWHNHPYEKPWVKDDPNQMMQFWNARHLWHPTWQGDSACLRVDSVKIQQY